VQAAKSVSSPPASRVATREAGEERRNSFPQTPAQSRKKKKFRFVFKIEGCVVCTQPPLFRFACTAPVFGWYNRTRKTLLKTRFQTLCYSELAPSQVGFTAVSDLSNISIMGQSDSCCAHLGKDSDTEGRTPGRFLPQQRRRARHFQHQDLRERYNDAMLNPVAQTAIELETDLYMHEESLRTSPQNVPSSKLVYLVTSMDVCDG